MDTQNIKPTTKETVTLIIEDIRKTALSTNYSFSSEEFDLIVQLPYKNEESITKEDMSRLLEISAAVKKTKEQRENELKAQEEEKQKELEEEAEAIRKAINGEC